MKIHHYIRKILLCTRRVRNIVLGIIAIFLDSGQVTDCALFDALWIHQEYLTKFGKNIKYTITSECLHIPSSSSMVISVVPGVPTVNGDPACVDKPKVNTSSASTISSEIILTFIVLELTPGTKNTCWFEIETKSTPGVAVLAVDETLKRKNACSENSSV